MTPIVPTTGITMSHIMQAFNNKHGGSMSAYLGKHPALPTSGPIQYEHFKGLTAVTPTFMLTSTQGTNLTLNPNGSISGDVSLNNGAMTLDLRNLVKDKSYHPDLQFFVTSGSLPPGVTLASNGILSANLPKGSPLSANGIVITASNSYGNTSTFPLSFAVTGIPPPLVKPGGIPQTNLGENSTQLDMNNYFLYATSYNITDNPQNNAWIDRNMLNISGAYRNTNYVLKIGGSNASGYISQDALVHEDARPDPRSGVVAWLSQNRYWASVSFTGIGFNTLAIRFNSSGNLNLTMDAIHLGSVIRSELAVDILWTDGITAICSANLNYNTDNELWQTFLFRLNMNDRTITKYLVIGGIEQWTSKFVPSNPNDEYYWAPRG